MKYAIVENGIVVNIVSSNQALGEGWELIPFGCPVDIGDTCENGMFYDADGNVRLTPEQRLSNERIAESASRIAELEMQNNMLMECILEMSEVVYA